MADAAQTTSAAASPDVTPTPSLLARVLEAILIVFLLIVLPGGAVGGYRRGRGRDADARCRTPPRGDFIGTSERRLIYTLIGAVLLIVVAVVVRLRGGRWWAEAEPVHQ